MTGKLTTSYLGDSLALFRNYKQLGERAMAQVTDEQLLATLDPEMNSIALIVKHMAGNMRSRWTGFLTSDREKPDRRCDAEFTVESHRGSVAHAPSKIARRPLPYGRGSFAPVTEPRP